MNRFIDWKRMSELGLVERINREICHPLGLAVSYDVESGISSKVMVAEDGVWEYSKSNVEVKQMIYTSSVTQNMADFITANSESLINYGSRNKGGGVTYRMNDGSKFTLSISDLKSALTYQPKWDLIE